MSWSTNKKTKTKFKHNHKPIIDGKRVKIDQDWWGHDLGYFNDETLDKLKLHPWIIPNGRTAVCVYRDENGNEYETKYSPLDKKYVTLYRR